MAYSLGRLKRRAEFLRIAAAQRKWAAPGVILQTALRPVTPDVQAGEEVRVGYTCSKKVGNAVARNRAKRRLREAARQILGEEAIRENDYVLIGRQETLRRPFVLLLQDLRTALKRVGALRNNGGTSNSSPGHTDSGANVPRPGGGEAP